MKLKMEILRKTFQPNVTQTRGNTDSALSWQSHEVIACVTDSTCCHASPDPNNE